MRFRKGFSPCYGGLRLVPAALAFALHQTRIVLGDMIFFVRQVEYYCHLEVVACQWKELEDFISKKDGDLDKLIEAHRRYVTTMVDKALLRASGRRKKEAKPLFDQLRDIFKVMLQHKNVAVRAPLWYACSLNKRLMTLPTGRPLRLRDAVRVARAQRGFGWPGQFPHKFVSIFHVR